MAREKTGKQAGNSKKDLIAREETAAFARLTKAAARYKGAYIASIALAIVGVGGKVVPYVFLAQIIGALLDGTRDASYFGALCAGMALSYVIGHVSAGASTALSHKGCYQTLADIRAQLLAKMYTMPLGYVQSKPTGTLKTTIIDRIESLEPTLAHVVPEMTANVVVPVFILAYMFVLDWRIALISLIVIPLALVLMTLSFKDYEENFQKATDLTAKVNAALVEFINGIEVIKVFNQSAQSYKRFREAACENADFVINWFGKIAAPAASAQVVAGSSLLFVLPAGFFFVSEGTLTASAFFQLVVLTVSWAGPILAAFRYPDQIAAARVTARQVFSVVSENDLVRPAHSQAASGSDIVLSQVHFSYQGAEEPAVEALRGIDLAVGEGETLALVGPSGSGKSTIGKLIAGFWDPTEGRILIGGADLRDISLEEAGRLVSYVSQDLFLFNATIEENLRIGKPKATSSEIEQAVRAAGCHDFISKLPQGYQTVVGDRGGHLSGGERQRITIARAMLKDTPIIVMDEATAFTDPDSEAQIEEALSSLIAGKTLVVIAHRLSTVRSADKIAVIDGGAVAGLGTHESLLENCDLYRSMWESHIDAQEL